MFADWPALVSGSAEATDGDAKIVAITDATNSTCFAWKSRFFGSLDSDIGKLQVEWLNRGLIRGIDLTLILALRIRVVFKQFDSFNAVISAGMLESSAMDGNLSLRKCLIQNMCQCADSHPCDWIPAVHAGMTAFLYLCITTRAPAWEPGI
ncbi:MAG: hypothetical protein NTX45_15865 [Proteobacteria bacterium]|nr:hypothetical protein [Pseudomonadota bacterium]